MEPVDALLFEGVVRVKLRGEEHSVSAQDVCKELGITGEGFWVAESSLRDLGLLHLTGLGGRLSPYGLAFWKACNPQSLEC